MNDIFNIKSPNWLGGNNVHNTIQIGLLLLIAYKIGAFQR
jgi:hypothetical protein